uniref:RRM domain-containing protein n=1 Tax=Salarias fasciatus TaxID=181472 RepID=A0A672JCD7_SALFA
MAPRLRKRQIKVTEEADVNPDDQAETVSSSGETPVTEEKKLTEGAEAEVKQKDEEDQNEPDVQMDIEVKGGAPTVSMSWESSTAEGADVHTEETAAAEAMESETQPETTSSDAAVGSTEEAPTQTEEAKVEQDVKECGDKQDGQSAPTVAVTCEKENQQEKSEDAEKEADQMTNKDAGVNGEQRAHSEDDAPPAKKAKVVDDGFRVFFGNLNDSKTREEVKSSLESYLKSQSLAFDNLKLNRTRKFAFVDCATELDRTKALELNGEVLLDKPMKIAKANVKSANKDKVEVKVPAVDKKGKRAHSEDDAPPAKKAKVVDDGFRVFFGNLNDSKTREEVKSSLESYLKSQSLAFDNLKLNRTRKFAFVDCATELDRTKALELNGEVLLDKPMKIAKANVKSANKDEVEVKVPAVDKKAAASQTNTLLVSNLSDTTTGKHLQKVFPEAVSIRIRQSKSRPDVFAFVEFVSVDAAAKALKLSQGVTVCKRPAKVQFSQNPKPEEGKVLSTTLIVMHLSDRTTGEMLQSAFEGAVSGRVAIDKETGLSKRFGFVEFESEENCKAAKEAMEDCLIDGRRVIIAYAKEQVKKVPAGQTGSPRDGKGSSGETATGKRKADSAAKTPPPKKTKMAKDVKGEQRAGPAAETPPPEKSSVINNDLSLYVGNLNNSKQFEEIKTSLATYFLTQSLLFQDIRLDQSKKHAFVDFASEVDLAKALTLNGEVILDKPVKIAKATSKGGRKAEVNSPKVEKTSKRIFDVFCLGP